MEEAREKEKERKEEEMKKQLAAYVAKISAKVKKSRQRKAITVMRTKEPKSRNLMAGSKKMSK